MNDFLRNLRNPRKKDPSDPKKNPETPHYLQNTRRKMPDRLSGQPDASGMFWACMTDILPQLSDKVTELIDQLNKRLSSDMLLAEAAIRQHNAASALFEDLGRALSREADRTVDRPPKVTASYASGTHYTKDEVLSLIRSMRDNDATFAAIAETLKEKGIPTFSGRGDWHAQTIHRLCR